MEDIPLISGILFAILFSLTTLIYFIISLLEYSFFQVPSNYSDNNQKPKNVIEFYIKNFIRAARNSPLFTWFIFRILIIISQTILLWLFLINYFTFLT